MKILASLATASLLVANIATAEVSPASIDGATTVSIEAAADLFGNGVKFVDVRKPADVEAGRIEMVPVIRPVCSQLKVDQGFI